MAIWPLWATLSCPGGSCQAGTSEMGVAVATAVATEDLVAARAMAMVAAVVASSGTGPPPLNEQANKCGIS
jgi:hypothetical protein